MESHPQKLDWKAVKDFCTQQLSIMTHLDQIQTRPSASMREDPCPWETKVSSLADFQPTTLIWCSRVSESSRLTPAIWTSPLSLVKEKGRGFKFPNWWRLSQAPTGRARSQHPLEGEVLGLLSRIISWCQQSHPAFSLPLLGKVLRRFLMGHLWHYLESSDFLHPSQLGFAPGYGTETVLGGSKISSCWWTKVRCPCWFC